MTRPNAELLALLDAMRESEAAALAFLIAHINGDGSPKEQQRKAQDALKFAIKHRSDLEDGVIELWSHPTNSSTGSDPTD